ncbi:DUF551 domain-containing protein [Raoultella terrigena]|uniref:DUF551 domain-containing protein n=1 Tax=Raoultella terrigena TaxID=577 RepID=UPI00349FA7A1
MTAITSTDLRNKSIGLYTPPFRFEHGYIWDAKGRMVADNHVDGEDAALRVRGWGRISYMENPEALQDEVGNVIALAMTEFWERRKADSEPVAEVVSVFGDSESIGERELKLLVGIQNMPYGTKFYRHAQPAPVVSADLLHSAASAIEDLLTTKDRTGAGVWFDLPFKLRSAANAQQPVVPDAYVRDEHGRMMLNGVCEPKIGFGAGWNACRAAKLQAGNSPVHSGLRPEQNIGSPAQSPIDHGYRPDCECSGCKAMGRICAELAGWIPVSERLPEKNGTYQVWNGKHVGAEPFLFGSFQRLNPEQVTHWMPTAKPPREVNNG